MKEVLHLALCSYSPGAGTSVGSESISFFDAIVYAGAEVLEAFTSV